MSGDNKVGYKNPPTATQFPKGISGNPNGRPKGQKNVATLFHAITQEMIDVTESGKKRSMTKIEAIVRQMVNRAMKGDQKAAKDLLYWNHVFSQSLVNEGAQTPDRERDLATMRSMLKRMKQHNGDL